MYNLVDFSEKKILIAGASSGIGRETALLLNRLGASVILTARREDKLREVMDQTTGDDNACYAVDYADLDSIEGKMGEIVREQGSLDGLVYCAGIGTATPLNMFKPAKMQAVFNVNYFGFIETVRQVTKKGRFNTGMRIVGISSVAAVRGDKTKTAYSGSKAAMDSSVRCMARELADKGICINTVAPAMTATELYQQFQNQNGQTDQSLLRRQYLGIIQTTDVANAIAFLLSPAARMITGITLPVDGGLTTS